MYFKEPNTRDLLHSAVRITIILGALTAANYAKADLQFYDSYGQYQGSARSTHSRGSNPMIPLQLRGIDPNAFGNAFALGAEMRRLQNSNVYDPRARVMDEDDMSAEQADALRKVEALNLAIDRKHEAFLAAQAQKEKSNCWTIVGFGELLDSRGHSFPGNGIPPANMPPCGD